MKTLNKLGWVDTPEDRRVIALEELNCVSPHSFERDGVTVDLVSISKSTINGNDLLTVIARCWVGGAEVEVDNPLLYLNPPMMVADGTFDINGEPNFIEDSNEAMRQIVTHAIRCSALGVA